jgi:hypothetical protein
LFEILPEKFIQALIFIYIRKEKPMVSMKTPDGSTVTIKPIIKQALGPMKVMSPRLTIRSDEAARRRIADTDGTVRRARQVAETNRLI